MPSLRRRVRDVEATGRAVGLELAPSRCDTREDAFETMLASLGFQPQRQAGESGRLTFCLGNCPYRDAVRETQEVICTLHRGLTRGLWTCLSPGPNWQALRRATRTRRAA
jgi:predicted ArsR family transcriptional regulator